MMDFRLPDILFQPPNDWDIEIAQLSGDERAALASELCALSTRMALAAGYVDARAKDQPHDKAVTNANKFRTAMRAVIGFAQPRDDVQF